MYHELKTATRNFQAILDGKKNFEVRDNSDRGFQAGDTVMLREYVRTGYQAGNYTGRKGTFEVGYVTSFEQKPNWVVFSLLPREPNVFKQNSFSEDRGPGCL